jgi:hypothetical protein
MTGKYALYLPYKVLDSLARGNVTDSQFKEFIMGLAEYDKSGTFPTSSTAGFTMMFELLRPDLDFAKAKYEDIIEKRREAGKKGGKSRSQAKIEAAQNNARKDRGNNPHLSKRSKTKQTKQITDDSIQLSDISIQKNDDDNSEPSSSLYKYHIQKISKSLGFTISLEQANSFILNLSDKTWLEGEFNFLVYAAEKAKGAEKPHNEQTCLFVKSWKQDFCIQEYPAWRENKIAEAAMQAERDRQEAAAETERLRIARARAAGPGTCRHCGESLAAPEGPRGSCPSCGYGYIFLEEKGEWDFTEPRSLAAEYERLIQSRNEKSEEKEAWTG